jgi:mono/diheme cytochrome c family protein
MYAAFQSKSDVSPRKLHFATIVGSCLLTLLPCFAYGAESPRESQEESTEPADGLSFFRDIRPIFQEHCHGCHQPAKPGGDYVMTTAERMLKGGESSETAIVARCSREKLPDRSDHSREWNGRHAPGPPPVVRSPA